MPDRLSDDRIVRIRAAHSYYNRLGLTTIKELLDEVEILQEECIRQRERAESCEKQLCDISNFLGIDTSSPEFNSIAETVILEVERLWRDLNSAKKDRAAVDWYAMMWDFHEKFDCVRSKVPAIPEINTAAFRMSLVNEEVDELRVAIDKKDLIAIADALADVVYVIVGTAVTFGIDLRPVFVEVHRSNMAKVGGGKRPDGKVLKPDGWIPPNVSVAMKERWDYPNDIFIEGQQLSATTKHISMPLNANSHNACNERCDMADGPCACGGWHTIDETLQRLVDLGVVVTKERDEVRENYRKIHNCPALLSINPNDMVDDRGVIARICRLKAKADEYKKDYENMVYVIAKNLAIKGDILSEDTIVRIAQERNDLISEIDRLKKAVGGETRHVRKIRNRCSTLKGRLRDMRIERDELYEKLKALLGEKEAITASEKLDISVSEDLIMSREKTYKSSLKQPSRGEMIWNAMIEAEKEEKKDNKSKKDIACPPHDFDSDGGRCRICGITVAELVDNL